MQINVDTREIDRYADRLGTLHRSALPTAIRATLNGAAFEMKKNTLLQSARRNFVERDKNFFRAFSKVQTAQGWDINSMVAIVGFSKQGLKGKDNYAVENLEQQESGGVIKSRRFIPARDARIGRKGVTRRQLTFDKTADRAIKADQITTRNYKGTNVSVKSDRERFTVAVFKAGKGGFVMTKSAIFRVNSLNRTKSGSMKLSLIYTKRKQKNQFVKPTDFVREAADKARKVMPRIFRHEAERQFKKHLG